VLTYERDQHPTGAPIRRTLSILLFLVSYRILLP
jgi:hypothetical protein